MTNVRWLAFLGVFLLSLYAPGLAASAPERTQFGSDIHVQPEERTSDVTCFNCSIYFAGKASGDVTAFHGHVVIEPGAEVAGDVTVFWGSVRTESGTQIAGDLTAIAGSAHRDAQSTIAGSVTSLQGSKWLLALVLPPLIFLGGIIALIIWLVQRSRARRPVPVYAQASTQPTTRG